MKEWYFLRLEANLGFTLSVNLVALSNIDFFLKKVYFFFNTWNIFSF